MRQSLQSAANNQDDLKTDGCFHPSVFYGEGSYKEFLSLVLRRAIPLNLKGLFRAWK